MGSALVRQLSSTLNNDTQPPYYCCMKVKIVLQKQPLLSNLTSPHHPSVTPRAAVKRNKIYFRTPQPLGSLPQKWWLSGNAQPMPKSLPSPRTKGLCECVWGHRCHGADKLGWSEEHREGEPGPGLELKGKGSWWALSEALLWEAYCYIIGAVFRMLKTSKLTHRQINWQPLECVPNLHQYLKGKTTAAEEQQL